MKTYFMNDINEDICQNCTEVKCLLAEVASVGKQNECLTEEIKQIRVKINDLLEALIEVVV